MSALDRWARAYDAVTEPSASSVTPAEEMWAASVALRAAVDAAPRPEGLDVERLARALEPAFGPSYFPGLTDVTIFGKTPREIAEGIAAEYARLSEPV